MRDQVPSHPIIAGRAAQVTASLSLCDGAASRRPIDHGTLPVATVTGSRCQLIPKYLDFYPVSHEPSNILRKDAAACQF